MTLHLNAGARLFLALNLVLAPRVSQLAAQSPAARVDSIFAFANGKTPGCAVAAVRDGAVEYARGYGMADLEHDVPITQETPFYLASVSKQFTAASVNLLAQGGELSLDDDVRKFVPELPNYRWPITLRHLMNHTSGLRDYLTLFGLAGLDDYPITNADFLEMVGRQRALNFRPGEQYSYSNTGYVLLSIIVKRVSGKSLRTFAQDRIFGPLGMTSTQFRDRHDMLIPRRALAYAPSSAGGYTMSVPYFDVVGDGGLFSTVEDLARWEGNFWEPRVGGAEWLTLEGARGRLNDGTLMTYGAGLIHGTYRGDAIVEHGGSLGGYNTDLLRFPARRFSVAVLCNGNAKPSSRLAQQVADVYLGDVLAPAAPATPALATAPFTVSRPSGDALARYAGTFFSDRALLVRRLVMEDGKLYYRRAVNDRTELLPLGNGRFAVSEMPIVVTFSLGADTLRVETPTGPPAVFQRVVSGSHHDRGSYAGSYASGELGVAWTVSASDSALTIRPARGDSLRLDPAFEDAFNNPFLFVRFIRGAKGQVVAMDVSAGERVRNVRFDRQHR